VDRYRSCVFWFSNWITGLFVDWISGQLTSRFVSQNKESHINIEYATSTLLDDTLAFQG
jgi:hypothetical protein